MKIRNFKNSKFDGFVMYKNIGTGFPGSKTAYNADTLILIIHVFEYDHKQCLKKGEVYDSDGEWLHTYKYKYDKEGNILSEKFIEHSGLKYSSDNSYNESNLRIKTSYSPTGIVEELHYDLNGNVLKKHNSKNGLSSYVYDYDKRHNFTSKKEFKGEARVPTFLTLRQIDYF
ncbi:MAG: hypothetical protein ACI9IP_001748 [Arcticibacterium sp.]|jgi:hypothetical protein